MAAAESLLDDTNSEQAEGVRRLGGDTLRTALIGRMTVLVGTAIIIAHWIGWVWTLAWAGGVCVIEAGVTPWIFTRVISPAFQDNRRAEGELALSVLALANTLAAMAGWVAAWIVGRDSFAFMAGLCLAGALVHANTYMTSSLRLYLIGFAPPVAVCMIGPFALGGAGDAPHWLIAIGAAQLALVSWLARGHTVTLSRSAADLETQWRRAMDANKAKSQFLATISHELRTPLNAVIGYAEMLEETLAADGRPEDTADAGRIHRSARTLLGLINEILDLSKIEAGRMDVVLAPANIREIVSDVVQTTALMAKEHRNEVAVDLELERDTIVTDGGKLRQCLLNLVSNACKFTDKGQIGLTVSLRGADLRIEVADTGCGIAPETAEKLFQPFVQGDGSFTRKHGGTGLGLAITRRMARLLGGDVTLKSVLGGGSVFTLTISAADGREPAPLHNVPAAA